MYEQQVMAPTYLSVCARGPIARSRWVRMKPTTTSCQTDLPYSERQMGHSSSGTCFFWGQRLQTNVFTAAWSSNVGRWSRKM